MKRRDFIRSAVAGTASIAAGTALAKTEDETSTAGNGKMPTREYGKTGIQLSVIGFGGIVVMSAEQDFANRIVAESVEKGINYFDVAPAYGDAEIKLGPALEPYRKNSFLACKTGERMKEGAEKELKRSLERLRTDHFDLYQLHAITDVKKDVDGAFQKGGAMEVFIEAKKQGQVRHLGFSAHSVEAAITAMDRYDFDSVLFPVNFASVIKGNFGPQILDHAIKKGVARLALKAMARQHWQQGDARKADFKKCWYEPLIDPKEIELGLRYTLSQPVTAAIPPGDEKLFRTAMDLAPDLKPLAQEDEAEVRKLAMNLVPLFPLSR